MYKSFRQVSEAVREKKGMTQKEFAEFLGITVSTYNIVTNTEYNLLPTLATYLDKMNASASILISNGEVTAEFTINHNRRPK